MKRILLVSLLAGFISTGFAQSSVVDVPANKIRPAYETAASAKSQATAVVQKVVAPAPVLNEVGLKAHAQPVDKRPVNKSSSVNEVAAVKKDN